MFLPAADWLIGNAAIISGKAWHEGSYDFSRDAPISWPVFALLTACEQKRMTFTSGSA